jgi:thiopeptide-type bacteriocin biosynthesis protein
MQSVAVFRKKALLFLLAQREAQRLGMSVEPDEIEAMVQMTRTQNHLWTEESLNEWRAAVGFDLPSFQAFMRECAVVTKLDDVLNDELSALAEKLMRIDQVQQSSLQDFPALPPLSDDDGWMQVNVSLSRHQDGSAIPAALALFDYLRERLPEWRTTGAVARFFFLRKPPDVRLRFLCPNGESEVARELELALRQLENEGFVPSFFRSPYEPEQTRFGGAEAMQIVHDYFDADTSQWLLLQRMRAAKLCNLLATTLLTGVLNHLFAAVVGDPAEVWAIWCQCTGLIGEESAHVAGDCLNPVFASIDALRTLASPEEIAILDAYEAANLAMAAGLKEVWSKGKLQRGVRGILATVAMFGFNRHGIDETAQTQLVHTILQGFEAKTVAAGSR